MSSVFVGSAALLAGMVLVGLRVHIGAAFGLVSIIGFAVILNWTAALSMAASVPFTLVGDWNMTAIPMFLFMGFIGSTTNLTAGLFSAMRMLLSRLPGGLALTSVGACAAFAAASGSSVATTSAMGRISVPEMIKYKYAPSLAAGVVASSGTLGSLIPPSLLMIIYGSIAEVSIAKLFMAGIIPGILSAGIYFAMIIVRVKANPELAPPVTETFTRVEKLHALKDAWPLPGLILFVLLGIFFGVFTPTEAGAMGSLAALVLAASRRTLTMKAFTSAVQKSVLGTGSLFMVIFGTAMLGRLMALTGVPGVLADFLVSIGSNEYIVVLLVAIVYIILGMFLDSIGIMLLTLPILLPLAASLDMDLIWFGILIIKLLEIGLITPPVGFNCYVLKGAVGNLVSLQDIFRGVSWFIVMDLVTLVILTLWPSISLWLPSLMVE